MASVSIKNPAETARPVEIVVRTLSGLLTKDASDLVRWCAE